VTPHFVAQPDRRHYSLVAGATTTPLLEREEQLEHVELLLGQARDGRGAFVLFEGAPGIGKSRLLGAACESAETLGVRVLRARGGELERDFSYGVVRQLFETRLAACGDDERARLFAGAARLASPLFEFGETDSWVARGEDASHSTLHGLFWLTANLAELRPLLLAVDDVHWCDPPSQRFLSYLARRLEGLPVAVAVSRSRSSRPRVRQHASASSGPSRYPASSCSGFVA
jgi:predicted ATPase